MDLFGGAQGDGLHRSAPLAARMRPRTLDEIAGQDHILAPGRLLRRAIEADRLSSIILFGPPGSGKTSLAEVIAATTRRHFERTSGVLAGVAELRVILQRSRQRRDQGGGGTILFVDEIHRFNKSQQDVLLPYVEDGSITLVGATTHNPMFFVNAPLTSRSLVFELKALGEDHVVALLRRAMEDQRGLGGARVAAEEAALRHLARVCEGDARRALNALETAVLTTRADADGIVRFTAAVAEDSIQKKVLSYDHDEDGHYDTISAFIKSIRGSDPHAALYWLAKMLYAGEDVRFIARRLIISASEDIGNADPRGLLMACAAAQGVDLVGMPESRIVLAQVVAYLATAPKSNAAYAAINQAGEDVEKGRALDVPEHLKNVHVRVAEPQAHDRYRYPHDFAGHFVPQEYVPTASRYYRPSREGYEETIRRRMEQWDERGLEQRRGAPAGG